MNTRKPARKSTLNPRVRQVLNLMAIGKSVPEISVITSTPERTIRARLERLRERWAFYGAATGLVGEAYRRRVLQPDSYITEEVA